MELKSRYFTLACLIILSIVLNACGTGQNHTVASPTSRDFEDTPTLVPATPTLTVTPTSTPARPVQTSELSPTPYPTPKPYLIKLVQGGGDGVDEIYICMAVYAPFPRFVLYEDGQLIFYGEHELVEAFLTDSEIDSLIEKIEATGYFNVGDSFEEHYNLPKDIQYGEGGWGVSVSVKGKDAYIHPQLTQYLVKPIQDAVRIIETYRPPKSARPYIPKDIELWTAPIDTGYFPTPEPPVEIEDWSTKLPPLNLYYIKLNESETESLINSGYFSGVPELRLFKQDGIVYWVLACPPWYGFN